MGRGAAKNAGALQWTRDEARFVARCWARARAPAASGAPECLWRGWRLHVRARGPSSGIGAAQVRRKAAPFLFWAGADGFALRRGRGALQSLVCNPGLGVRSVRAHWEFSRRSGDKTLRQYSSLPRCPRLGLLP